MSCCSKISDFLKSAVRALRPLIAVALLCFAAYMLVTTAGTFSAALGSYGAFLPATVASIAPSTIGYMALGLACLVDSASVTGVAGTIAETAGRVAGVVVAAGTAGLVDGLLNGTGSGSTSGLLSLLAAAGAFWFFFLRDKKEEEKDDESSKSEKRKKEKDKEAEETDQATPEFVSDWRAIDPSPPPLSAPDPFLDTTLPDKFVPGHPDFNGPLTTVQPLRI